MDKQQKSSLVGFSPHNHKRCVATALASADAYCREHRLRFTPVRRRSLSILLESHTAIGAYELLERLQQEGLGSKPPIVYRALGFLLDNGFVHRIERLNAYVACINPGDSHSPAFLICSECRCVAEATVNNTAGALSRTAKESGFQIQHTTIEAEGHCPDCQASSCV